ncbi:uncharacterized protein LOC124607431 [Schistocerca americana]|uniref:uncharacterized protein LOC124607431 n=1 Tax=Schistocerca americana TaxID=7009 RepID=UPI001F503F4D|nr:uncharacterized protein LOC124607431 [Schistocerca americana]
MEATIFTTALLSNRGHVVRIPSCLNKFLQEHLGCTLTIILMTLFCAIRTSFAHDWLPQNMVPNVISVWKILDASMKPSQHTINVIIKPALVRIVLHFDDYSA